MMSTIAKYMEAIMECFFIAVGIISIFGAYFDYDWFMNSGRTPYFVNLFGRNGTRALYIVMSIVLIVMGVLGLMGIIDLSEFVRRRPWQGG